MDEAEYTEWVTGSQHQLLRSAYLVTGDLHRAEDLVQDALVKVALRWSRLREGNPTAYARTIMMNQNVSWWRRRRLEVLTDDVRERGDEILERASATVPRPDLARAALEGAHRVRVRRRGLAAGGAAVALVAGVVVATSLGGTQAGREPDPAPPPASPSGAQAEAIPASVVQDFWDVTGVPGLPLRDSVLPERLEQPASAADLSGDPIPAAVVSLWGEGDVTYLLSPQGEWRSVPHPGPEPWLAELSDDGARLAMPGTDGLEVWDVAAGTSLVLPWPETRRCSPGCSLASTDGRWARTGGWWRGTTRAAR